MFVMISLFDLILYTILTFSRLFHSFRIACLKCFFMRRGLSDLKMSSIEPMSYMSRVSCAFIAQLRNVNRSDPVSCSAV